MRLISDKNLTRMKFLLIQDENVLTLKGANEIENTTMHATKTRTHKSVSGTGNSRGENAKVPPLTYTVAGRVQVVFPRVRKAKLLLSTKDWAITYQTIEL